MYHIYIHVLYISYIYIRIYIIYITYVLYLYVIYYMYHIYMCIWCIFRHSDRIVSRSTNVAQSLSRPFWPLCCSVAPAEDWSSVTRRPKKIQEIEVVFHCRGNFYCGENSVLSCLDNVSFHFASHRSRSSPFHPLSSPLIPVSPPLYYLFLSTNSASLWGLRRMEPWNSVDFHARRVNRNGV